MVPVTAVDASRENPLGVIASQPTLAPSAGADGAPGPDPAPAGADEDALEALLALVRPDLEACNRAIVARMDSPVA